MTNAKGLQSFSRVMCCVAIGASCRRPPAAGCLLPSLGWADHFGLYSEELSRTAEQLGSFPLAFTHLALISMAFDLNRQPSRAGPLVRT